MTAPDPVPSDEELAEALWARQVAPLDVCRYMAPRIKAALSDLAAQGASDA